MLQRILPCCIILLLLNCSWSNAQGTSVSIKNGAVEVQLISQIQSIQPAHSFLIALRLKMDAGWHTYWKNPGDSGLPTKIRWTLPEGFKAGPLQWPAPKKIVEGPLVDYGYEGEVFLLTKIEPPQGLPLGQTQTLKAKVDWLACEKQCVPGRANIEIQLPVKNETPLINASWKKVFSIISNKAPKEDSKPNSPPLGLALVFAFLGGLILNLMPCVLPVLSLKILGFIKHASDKKSTLWIQGLVFTSGVLVSFWILAGVLILLRAGGQQIGWGFQFQSPIFLLALSLLFFIFALNLFGLFEILLPFQIQTPKNKSGLTGVFFNGVLATLTATPCTAPFMGTALGFALTQSPFTAFLIFTSLGLGMSFPYILLSFCPSLLRFLPKPGPWMIRFKQFLGILLLGTAFWLLSILMMPQKDSSAIKWQTYSPTLVSQLRLEKRIVFIDFTARWCLTCQANERLTLDNSDVVKEFQRLNVATIKADWTMQDASITRALAGFGKNSIPLYVLYGKNSQEPVILSEIITPKTVLDALDKVSQ